MSASPKVGLFIALALFTLITLLPISVLIFCSTTLSLLALGGLHLARAAGIGLVTAAISFVAYMLPSLYAVWKLAPLQGKHDAPPWTMDYRPLVIIVLVTPILALTAYQSNLANAVLVGLLSVGLSSFSVFLFFKLFAYLVRLAIKAD